MPGHIALLRFANRGSFDASQNDATRDDRARTNAALEVWKASPPAAGTAVDSYLRGRGITLPVATSIRFHPRLKHPAGGLWPGMVALVTNAVDGNPVAIHRTFLSLNAEKAPVEPQRMMLGPCRDGVVRLAPAPTDVMVGEGIETCLAAMQATGRPAWAALSTSGLRTLNLPPHLRDVVVLADGDQAGEAAARVAARRWSHEGRRVQIARPPIGLDFNDLLLDRAF
jgi:hypothetical protein